MQPLVDAGGFDSPYQLQEHLRLNGPSIKDAIENGLTDERADVLACRLGLHPMDVWGWSWVAEWLGLFNPDLQVVA